MEYNVHKDGAVVAIRIKEGEIFPVAEIKTVSGKIFNITWTNKEERDSFAQGINGYTFIYDERQRVSFEEL